jgi:hypothetical protein
MELIVAGCSNDLRPLTAREENATRTASNAALALRDRSERRMCDPHRTPFHLAIRIEDT